MKTKRRNDIGGADFKFVLWTDFKKEELMYDRKEESLSWRKSKPADEEVERPMTEPRYL